MFIVVINHDYLIGNNVFEVFNKIVRAIHSAPTQFKGATRSDEMTKVTCFIFSKYILIVYSKILQCTIHNVYLDKQNYFKMYNLKYFLNKFINN